MELLTWPLEALADVSVNTTITGAISQTLTWYASFDSFLPITEILICLGIMVSFELVLGTAKIIALLLKAKK